MIMVKKVDNGITHHIYNKTYFDKMSSITRGKIDFEQKGPKCIGKIHFTTRAPALVKISKIQNKCIRHADKEYTISTSEI